jgi:hypothetical protein
MICPKFAGSYSLKINIDKSMELYANEINITNLVRKDFLNNQGKDNNCLINFERLKTYLEEKYNII